jgi:conjugal transfer pilus assembly protein TraW
MVRADLAARCCVVVGLALWFGVVRAQALGPVYEIVEPDMLAELKARLAQMQRSGQLSELLEQGRRRAQQSILNPRGAEDIPPAVRRRTHFFDPTLTVEEDIVTPDGVVIARRGQKINPLEHVSWPGVWVFFDARVPAQVREAKRLIDEGRALVKPVLVAGDYVQAGKTLAHRVYFDQQGVLVRRFGIGATPATVRQEGSQLRIDEYPVGG